MDIITLSNISIQKLYTNYFNRNNYNYKKYDGIVRTNYDNLIYKYLDYIIENLVNETICGESSINKLPDFPPQWHLNVCFNFYDFYYGNEYLFKTMKNITKPFTNICREMIKQIEKEIKWVLIHYLDKDDPNKDINKMELTYAISDHVDLNTGAMHVFFSWRILPKYWPKYLEYAKKNNINL